MKSTLGFTSTAKEPLKNLEDDLGLKKQKKTVAKTLELLEQNPRHPSLQIHPYYSINGPGVGKIILFIFLDNFL